MLAGEYQQHSVSDSAQIQYSLPCTSCFNMRMSYTYCGRPPPKFFPVDVVMDNREILHPNSLVLFTNTCVLAKPVAQEICAPTLRSVGQ